MKKLLNVALIVMMMALICVGGALFVQAQEHEHSGGVATCTDLAQCEVCGEPYGETNKENHTQNPIVREYPYDEDPDQYHVLVYGCCDREVIEAHVEKKAATCQAGKICKICNNQYGDLDPENHDLSTVICEYYNDTHHTVTCGCGYEYPSEVHSGGTATCSEKAVCEYCDAEYGSLSDVHDYENACDDKCDDCGATRTPAAHVFGEWKVTKKPTETKEGTRKRVCTVCGETETEAVAATGGDANNSEEPDGIKPVTVVIIVVAAVVVVAGAAVAAFLLIKKKKGAKAEAPANEDVPANEEAPAKAEVSAKAEAPAKEEAETTEETK